MEIGPERFDSDASPVTIRRSRPSNCPASTGLAAISRPALFSAPAEVTGSGESGSASFDVAFGYTGSYTAAPHGLEAATVTSDNVVQDPDQNFDPEDGYSNLHKFTLSGAAQFRIAMPPALENFNFE